MFLCKGSFYFSRKIFFEVEPFFKVLLSSSSVIQCKICWSVWIKHSIGRDPIIIVFTTVWNSSPSSVNVYWICKVLITICGNICWRLSFFDGWWHRSFKIKYILCLIQYSMIFWLPNSSGWVHWNALKIEFAKWQAVPI